MRKDIDISFTTHPLTGDLATKSGVPAINQSLRNIVLTNFYERGYFVEFGTNIKSSFENNIGDVLLQGMRQNIIRAIENFEPQVEVLEVAVYTPESDPTSITINIYYSVINTLEEQQLSINI